MTTGKTIALIIQTFVGKVMSLLFNMLSRFVTAFTEHGPAHQNKTQFSPPPVPLSGLLYKPPSHPLGRCSWPRAWGSSSWPLPWPWTWGSSNYHTTAHISHVSKVLLKILQARLQQHVNCELPDVQAGFRKGRGTKDQIANIHWIIKKPREF